VIKKISFIIIALGALIALVFLFSIIMEGGFHPSRILGIEIGILIALFGTALSIFQSRRKPTAVSFWFTLRDKFFELPAVVWIALGFLVNYVLYFIAPTFLNSTLHIQYPNKYIAEATPIGFDLLSNLESVRTLFVQNRIPNILNPPIVNFLFAPFLTLDHATGYTIITFATLISYALLIIFAILMSNQENHSSILLVGAITIFSYGLQFELERGQFYTIAMMLSLAAIYIFHKHRDFRFFAYLLFCLSIQMKYYPALLVIMFVDDWRDWKGNLKRFFALGLANFLLLFLQGIGYFNAFFHQLGAKSDFSEIWKGNHSIQSFVGLLSNSGLKQVDLVTTLLYAYVLICLAVVLVGAYWRNTKGFNADLLLAFTIGALVLPPISHDYALPMLTAPFALSLSSQRLRDHSWKGIMAILLIFMASLAYSATLFSFKYRSFALSDTFPFLVIILTAVTLLNILQGRQAEAQ